MAVVRMILDKGFAKIGAIITLSEEAAKEFVAEGVAVFHDVENFVERELGFEPVKADEDTVAAVADADSITATHN